MKLICFGDSVTRGITFIRGRFKIIRNNYPALLQRSLGEEDEVVNKGVFNDNSDLLIKRLDADVLDEHPDLVLINIGGNDCNFHWDQVAKLPDSEHVPIVPLERYLSNLSVMIQRISESGALPVVLSLLPLDPARYYATLMKHYSHSIGHWIGLCGGIEHWHGMYNRALKDFCDKSGVKLIDVRSAFKKKGSFSDLINEDGLHPTAKGYQVMAEIVSSYIPDLKKSWCKMRLLN
ncbi:SGNH/GDSL hydrolase family protein [Sporolactobacillus terrae]|uniref:Lipase/acylhydrolase n=1 Tax=Sporolactobacillus terrae TaxID=269673 RepID=A0A410D9D4_9BACL|nr:SGNH/GDSL hydrolase family protein [Sporolactobacillus terrae]QAA22695.1 SGNH/GDSL hydrolase family protein [Sporolactobacillus terrae]QAA25668.1 SGNH/GDSL hydrolase family protein [Sporolactobacillus terrae]UAK17479.1 SGNH/GDSL hydrolase family protein [Sporolactobacillus terrae]BBN99024.1 lipase/acylhydrolase [Sporolactobacillus terrae]